MGERIGGVTALKENKTCMVVIFRTVLTFLRQGEEIIETKRKKIQMEYEFLKGQIKL